MIAHLFQEPKNYVEHPAPPAPIDGPGQLERLASTFHDVDGLFYFTYIVCIVCFFLIAGVLAYSVVKYRRKTWDQPAASNVTHNTPLEVVWTVIPLIIVMVMFAWGWKGSLDMTVVPADARQYKAVAKQWNWTFYYPNSPIASIGEVWVELDKPVAFTLQSTDVLHAFFVPSMRVKRDVIPGRQQTIWFHPTQLGDYHLFCAEYCGKDHSKMYAIVRVVSKDEYAKQPWTKLPEDPVEAGKMVYSQLCASCHSTSGADGIGPTWKGIFSKEGDKYVGRKSEVLNTETGARETITVDDAYVIESIKKPNSRKVVSHMQNAMSAFPDLDDPRINGLLAYMKSLADGK